ncbi:MAG: MFS transporter, partial [bacterium]
MVMLSTGILAGAQLGSLIVYALNGTATLAGIPSAIFHLAMAATAYPAGRFMDRRGRRPGLVLGFLVGGLGAAFVMLSVSAGRFAGYLVSMIVYSLGAGVGMLSRGVVGDMYPLERRAGAVGFVVAGGLLGGLLGPSLVALGDRLARAIDANPLAVPWVFVCVAYAVAAVALTRLRPDPRDISARLHEYYSDAPDASESDVTDQWRTSGRSSVDPASVAAIVASRPAQAAMISLACAQATMVMLMATTSLMLSLHGHGTGTISLVLMAHVLGMYALA